MTAGRLRDVSPRRIYAIAGGPLVLAFALVAYLVVHGLLGGVTTENTAATEAAIAMVTDVAHLPRTSVKVMETSTFDSCAVVTLENTASHADLSIVLTRSHGRWTPARSDASVPGYAYDEGSAITAETATGDDGCRLQAQDASLGPAWPQGVAAWGA